jgi:predicted nucleic acid-binding protein
LRFRREADYQQAKLLLQHLAIYDLLGRDAVEEYARYFRILRKRGITIRKTADVIIAGFCIVNRIPLLFEDKDFRPFVKHLGLRSVLQAA